MTNPAVAANFNQTLDIESGVAAKVAFHAAVVFDILSQFRGIVFRHIAHAQVGVNAGVLADIGSGLAADPVDISQGNFNAFVSGQVNT